MNFGIVALRAHNLFEAATGAALLELFILAKAFFRFLRFELGGQACRSASHVVLQDAAHP
jgi:hypothetical protein